jgi:8-oxo-dGTP pyrophosphatase MutT (NUDIX family)
MSETVDIRDVIRFTAADFRRRAQRLRDSGLGQDAHRGHGDHTLNPDLVATLDRVAVRPAAVLVGVVDRAGEAHVILTLRAAHLRKHSSQIAFPGGAVDPTDASLEAAAVREAQEEIDLDPAFVEPVGRLPDYLTMTGFRITPVLAIVRPGYKLRPNPEEVDSVFDVPLSFLMERRNHIRQSRMWEGRERHYYTMPYKDRFIWGVTAGIVRTLFERLYE